VLVVVDPSRHRQHLGGHGAGIDGATAALTVTRGQLDVEAGHLLAKLEQRSPSCAAAFPPVADVVPHPLFTVVPGPVADWERAQPTTP